MSDRVFYVGAQNDQRQLAGYVRGFYRDDPMQPWFVQRQR